MATLLIVGSDQNDWEGVYVCVGEEGKGGIYSFYYFMNIIYFNEKNHTFQAQGAEKLYHIAIAQIIKSYQGKY